MRLGGGWGAGRQDLFWATGDSVAVDVGIGRSHPQKENEGTRGKNKIILRLAPSGSRSRRDRS